MKTLVKASTRIMSKPASRKRVANLLASCPVNGAGWCPYPFSPAQLKKHLKLKAMLASTAATAAKQELAHK
ncbi:MAG: hypothetical protein HY711_03065 [Candidatus Melainabacteria bacterium]|nr:hypothetical protein [Candidatus Melainabacteria bacterium]